MNNKIATIRKRRGYTQAYVAERAGLVDTAFQRYEYGLCNPNVEIALRIAKALGTTVEELWKNSPT